MKKIVKIFVIMIGISFVWQASWHLYYNQLLKDILPSKIELGWWFWQDGSRGLFGSCGMFFYTMSESTADSVKVNGLGFFSGVKKSRTGRTAYGKWMKVASTDRVFTEGRPAGMKCAQRNSIYYPKIDDIWRAIGPGRRKEYYSVVGGDYHILVLPHLKIVVGIYS